MNNSGQTAGGRLRISESLGLKVKDVDLEKGFLFIHGAKFGRDRKIPMSDSLLQYLKNPEDLAELVIHRALGIALALCIREEPAFRIYTGLMVYLGHSRISSTESMS